MIWVGVVGSRKVAHAVAHDDAGGLLLWVLCYSGGGVEPSFEQGSVECAELDIETRLCHVVCK